MTKPGERTGRGSSFEVAAARLWSCNAALPMSPSTSHLLTSLSRSLPIPAEPLGFLVALNGSIFWNRAT